MSIYPREYNELSMVKTFFAVLDAHRKRLLLLSRQRNDLVTKIRPFEINSFALLVLRTLNYFQLVTHKTMKYIYVFYPRSIFILFLRNGWEKALEVAAISIEKWEKISLPSISLTPHIFHAFIVLFKNITIKTGIYIIQGELLKSFIKSLRPDFSIAS